MTTLTIAIVVVFILGYACIALESVTKVNKAAIALLMFVATWTLFMMDPASYIPNFSHELVNAIIEKHLGSTGTTLFFLMGAMTIVEIVDQNGGFNFVRNALRTTSKRRLLWRIVFMTFFLSAILDNMTTSIVMVMVLRKLVDDRQDRLMFASLVIIAANSGGAFSPIGDVTTIMLWNKGLLTAQGVITEIFLPSLVSAVVPALIMQWMLKGQLDAPASSAVEEEETFTSRERKTIFCLGVGGLCFVPIFHNLTSLPPFVGILLVLGVLWTTIEIFYRKARYRQDSMKRRVSRVLSRIDMSTILFFLGILMAVSCLEEIKVLELAGQWLNDISCGNHYLVTGIIGVISSIVDNVPLVAGCMGMYTDLVGDYAVDGLFWQLLAYCAGVGGSILIVGSAAGVVVMGLERINFGWYMKKISWLVAVGYFAGIIAYWLQNYVVAMLH
ncbi:MAG: sodium:proton antiporter NhaD [Bacteroidales bacterium]|nr:sodium:proton antiporter NhaD [Bacteroidales bacterium]